MLAIAHKPVRSRRWFYGLLAALALAAAVPGTATGQVVVVANGSPITEFDIQQRTKLILTSTHKAPTRQEVITDLIDDRLKIAKAKFYGFEVPADEVEQAFGNMAKRQGISVKQFSEVLTRAGIAPETVKARIKAELTWAQLVRSKFGSSLQIGEADVAHAMSERHDNNEATDIGYIYTLYPITLVVGQGGSEADMVAKRREAENLRGRFNNCRDGLALARALRDVAVREPITRTSADLPEATRKVLADLPIGHLTTPDVTAQGLQMFALCDKKETKQDSPLKSQVRNEIYAKRFDREAKRYMDEIRKAAMIEYKTQ